MALPKIFKNINARLKKSGDTMSGPLAFNNGNSKINANNNALIQQVINKDNTNRQLLLNSKDYRSELKYSLSIKEGETNYFVYGEHNKPTYETVGAPSKTGSGASGTCPINISGTAATSTGINTYKVISFTTPSAGWYRIASVGSLSIPRGQVRFSIVGKGGSSTPLSCDIKIDTSWSDAGVNEISADGSSYHVNGCRIGHDGTNTYIEIYTPIKIQSTTNIVVPYNLADHWQNTKWNWTSGGELQTSSSTTISYVLSGWNSGISTSNYMTSAGFLTRVATDYATFRARSAACGTGSAPSNMGNGEMWIRY